ncbi:glycosyltransferase family protein [Nocardioides cavernaquae]|uniref:Glycosyltransferase n=1 Tax=Nocardioides cavernaquae TaxID=2321396 RepID=A0A3A5HE49_9ACTN|nr:glycosyltransferase [Nocardioides cavernaquae]RJS46260.1 glycosyltransferase [Nocardioides cavernaquae]
MSVKSRLKVRTRARRVLGYRPFHSSLGELRFRARPRIPEAPLPLAVPRRPDLRVAVILDPFSELAFGYEWDQVAPGPDDWRRVLSGHRPDLLFVESAWGGNGGRWRLHMTRDNKPSEELRALVSWCRAEGIPTVFWNKEDPPGYEKFLETARLFDQVFTVDADRIPWYQRDLGHDRIALLPFSAQPHLHNPVRRGHVGRSFDVAFAGTWHPEKHPERRRQMEFLLVPACEFGLHIWSRMEKDAKHRFPGKLGKRVVGSLPYEQMLTAYARYKVFLNVNSVTESPTMCARRLFELSAAQTAVVSAPAASIEPFFGDTITVVSTAEEARAALAKLIGSDDERDRLALRAHRRVFDEHLLEHRVESVLLSVGIAPSGPDQPLVSVIVPTHRPDQLDNVFANVGRQSHRRLELVLVTHGFEVDEAELRQRATAAGVSSLVVVPAPSELTLGACMNLGVDAAIGDLVAKVDDDNYYGVHYLTDLVRALDFSGADVVGKWAHFVHLEASDATLLRFASAEHRFVDLVQGGTLLTRRSVVRRIPFADIPRAVDTTFLTAAREAGLTVYAADRFNFVSVRRADPGSHTWTITDSELLAKSSTHLLFHGQPFGYAEV